MAHTVMRKLKITEISGVDRPAQQGAKAAILKRNTSADAGLYLAKADGAADLPAAVEEYLKRQLSADLLKSAISAGEAMADGSFPIQSRGDLENAIRGVGRAKDAATAKAHITARARALDATSLLPDAWKAAKSIGGDLIREIARIAPRALPDLLENINKAEAILDNIEKLEDAKIRKALAKDWGIAKDALVTSAWSIVDSAAPDDAVALLQKNFVEYKDHVAKLLTPAAPRAGQGEAEMLKALAKKLGLAETATEAEITAAMEKADALAARNAEIAKFTAVEKGHFDGLKTEAEKTEFLAKSVEDRAKIVKAAKKKPADAEDDEDEADDCMKVDGKTIRKADVGDSAWAILKNQQDRIEKAETTAAIGVIAKRITPVVKYVGGNVDDMASLLHRVTVGKSTAADATAIEAVLKTANELIGKSDVLTKELGGTGGGGQFNKAADGINAKAQEIVTKWDASKGKRPSIEKARDLARQQNPELAKQEEEERRDARKAA